MTKTNGNCYQINKTHMRIEMYVEIYTQSSLGQSPTQPFVTSSLTTQIITVTEETGRDTAQYLSYLCPLAKKYSHLVRQNKHRGKTLR